jgi:hypothetical protein
MEIWEYAGHLSMHPPDRARVSVRLLFNEHGLRTSATVADDWNARGFIWVSGESVHRVLVGKPPDPRDLSDGGVIPEVLCTDVRGLSAAWATIWLNPPPPK